MVCNFDERVLIMFKKIVLVLFVSLALVGCGDKKIDTSSKAAFDRSTEEIAKTLEGEKKAKFELIVTRYSLQSSVQSLGDDEKALAILKEKLGGKTADEVLAENW